MTDVKQFCNEIMKGVVETGVVTEDNGQVACDVMKAEVKEFLFGDKYKEERECILNGEVHEGYVTSLLIAECANLITNAGRI